MLTKRKKKTKLKLMIIYDQTKNEIASMKNNKVVVQPHRPLLKLKTLQ